MQKYCLLFLKRNFIIVSNTPVSGEAKSQKMGESFTFLTKV